MSPRYPGGVPNLADDVFEQIDVDAGITQIEKAPPLRRCHWSYSPDRNSAVTLGIFFQSFTRALPPQDGHLMSQGDELKLQ
jgi:hypothetical protein